MWDRNTACQQDNWKHISLEEQSKDHPAASQRTDQILGSKSKSKKKKHPMNIDFQWSPQRINPVTGSTKNLGKCKAIRETQSNGFHLGIYGPSISSTREGNGTPLQYSCLENPMDGGAWWAAVYGVTQSRTRLSDFTFTFHFHALE